jgi:putative transposase
MPGTGRAAQAHHPFHVVQLGHRLGTVFAEDGDYQHYLDALTEWKVKLGCRVYAYALMSNRVHLVVEPGAEPGSLGWLMRQVAGHQARRARGDRHGARLWAGRFSSRPIDGDAALLRGCRSVELHPVRAGLVRRPAEYRWSSYRYKVGLNDSRLIDLDPVYLGLGATPATRMLRYACWVAGGMEWLVAGATAPATEACA